MSRKRKQNRLHTDTLAAFQPVEAPSISGVDRVIRLAGSLGTGNPPEKVDCIIGAGPAGLSAAMELLSGEERTAPVAVFEQENFIGGLCRTAEYHGNRMDIGGHRFFTRIPEVMEIWKKILPLQGKPSSDELLTGTVRESYPGSVYADPEKNDHVFLLRRRISRIFFDGHFFDYPVTLSWKTVCNLGLSRFFAAGFAFLASRIHPRKVRSLEDYYINSFGKVLYSLFFEDYTCKVWGKHPSELDADWGTQRVKGMTLWSMALNFLGSLSGLKRQDPASLIHEFHYPKLGPGSMWEKSVQMIRRKDGDVFLGTQVREIRVRDNHVESVLVRYCGEDREIPCRNCFSSMPLPELLRSLKGIRIPPSVRKVADGLEFRDFITVGVLVRELKLRNRTQIRTWNDRIPDTWIYVQDSSVKMGRIQVFNNWSPYLVKDYEHTVWLGLEYFCREGDSLWKMSDEDFLAMASSELEKLGIAEKKDILDSVRIRVRKAYPSYTGTYRKLETLRKFLDSIDNLYCIGRNGQHRYNNMDHSMMTGILAARASRAGDPALKSAVWNVNTETDYHEEVKASGQSSGKK